MGVCGQCNSTGPQFFRGLKTIAYPVINNSIFNTLFNIQYLCRIPTSLPIWYSVVPSMLFVRLSNYSIQIQLPECLSPLGTQGILSPVLHCKHQSANCKASARGTGRGCTSKCQTTVVFFFSNTQESCVIISLSRQTTIVPQIHQKLEMIGTWRPAPGE